MYVSNTPKGEGGMTTIFTSDRETSDSERGAGVCAMGSLSLNSYMMHDAIGSEIVSVHAFIS